MYSTFLEEEFIFRVKVFENLKYIGGPPSVQMQDIPSDAMSEREEDEEKRNKDVRISSEWNTGNYSLGIHTYYIISKM